MTQITTVIYYSFMSHRRVYITTRKQETVWKETSAIKKKKKKKWLSRSRRKLFFALHIKKIIIIKIKIKKVKSYSDKEKKRNTLRGPNYTPRSFICCCCCCLSAEHTRGRMYEEQASYLIAIIFYPPYIFVKGMHKAHFRPFSRTRRVQSHTLFILRLSSLNAG